MIKEASGISDYNVRSYFVRRLTDDYTNSVPLTTEEAESKLAQLQRIKAVHNLYSTQVSVVESRR